MPTTTSRCFSSHPPHLLLVLLLLLLLLVVVVSCPAGSAGLLETPDSECRKGKTRDTRDHTWLQVAKFGQVRCLTLFIDTNHGEDTTRITYLNFRGIFTQVNTEPVIAVYELKPVADDLRNRVNEAATNMPGF
jgi:hypothetical protein